MPHLREPTVNHIDWLLEQPEIRVFAHELLAWLIGLHSDKIAMVA